MNTAARNKIRCPECGGFSEHTGLSFPNIKFSPYLFLNIHVDGTPEIYRNQFKDYCKLNQSMSIDNSSLELIGALMVQQSHFYSICSISRKFFKFDNLIEGSSVGYPSFKEAYCGKTIRDDKDKVFHLSSKTINPKKGAVYFVVYKVTNHDFSDKKMDISFNKQLIELHNLLNLTYSDDLSQNASSKLEHSKEALIDARTIVDIAEDSNDINNNVHHQKRLDIDEGENDTYSKDVVEGNLSVSNSDSSSLDESSQPEDADLCRLVNLL